jgi:8-amino-7-oxononanoate synthase
MTTTQESNVESPTEKTSFKLEYGALQKRLNDLREKIANPYFKTSESFSQNTIRIQGKEYVNYTSYDYLSLSTHPHVAKSTIQALEKYGTSCSASRIVGGDKVIHRELEKAISDLIGTEDSIVFVGGYTTNVSTISHLFSSKDLIIHDSLAHNSILKGVVYSGAKRYSFTHNDYEDLEAMLARHRDKYIKVLIVIEGVYSMDGDIPDIPRIIALKKKYDAWLMVDEAHSMGVLGKTGISEHFSIDPKDVEIWMGTLSKAFASCGGYIAGNKDLIEYLRYTASGFIYSVGMSPPGAGAALGAIQVLLNEPERVQRLNDRSKLFLDLCTERGYNVGRSKDSPIIPMIIGNSEKTLVLSEKLYDCGINVQPILSPGVEENATRLRFFMTCNHTEEQIRSTVHHIEQCLKSL